MPPLAAKAAEEGGEQPESGGKSRKTADLTLEKDQKDGIQGPQRIVQWSHTIKIIAIGAVGTAREVVEYDPEMRNRVSEIHVPLMSVEELKDIVVKGESCMNISFEKKVIEKIISHCNGLAAVCHQLCLNLCFEIGVESTLDNCLTVGYDRLDGAFRRYVAEESDSIKAVFDKALVQKKKRKYDNCWIILEALASADEDAVVAVDILQRIKKDNPTYPYTNLSRYLSELQSEDRGAIVRFDERSKKYSFSNPFHKVFMKMLARDREDKRGRVTGVVLSSLLQRMEAFFLNEKNWKVVINK